MTTLESFRAVLLAFLAACFLCFDLLLLHQMPFADPAEFTLLAIVHLQLAGVLAGIVWWPDRRLMRLIFGGFALALTWLCLTMLVNENFLFRASLLTQLAAGLLMLASFSLPCGGCFVVYRCITGRTLSLFGRPRAGRDSTQFGMRHLLIFTTCFAVLAFAARPVSPHDLAGQFVWDIKPYDATILVFLTLFPGLLAGPLMLAIMRPSWRSLLIVPWFLLLVACELAAVEWALTSSLVTSSVEQTVKAALSIAQAHLELAAGLVAACLLARLVGLKLA